MVRYIYIFIVVLLFPFSAFAAIDYYDWSQIGEDGFGNVNYQDHFLVEYHGSLYLRTGVFGNGVPLFKSQDGQTWTELDPDFNDDLNNLRITELKEFDDQFFALIQNNTTGLELWRTDNGADWFQAGSDGMGAAANRTGLIYEDGREGYEERYYIATNNAGGAQLYYSDGGWAWNQATINPGPSQIMAFIQNFGGYVYITTFDVVNGTKVFRSANGINWTEVSPGTFSNSAYVYLMEFDGYLYGIENYANLYTGLFNKLWRTSDGQNWEEITYTSNNDVDQLARLITFNNYLLIFSQDNASGGNVYYSDTGETGDWYPAYLDKDGTNYMDVENIILYPLQIDNQLFFSTYNNINGTEIWRTSNGAYYEPFSPGGFGDANNWRGNMVNFENDLYVGTYNANTGGEVWTTEIQPAQITDLAITPKKGKLNLSWTVPAATNLVGYTVRCWDELVTDEDWNQSGYIEKYVTVNTPKINNLDPGQKYYCG
ncbi:MAG: hypothetical protein ABID45_03830, partial [Patescibacteria group bacterium]